MTCQWGYTQRDDTVRNTGQWRRRADKWNNEENGPKRHCGCLLGCSMSIYIYFYLIFLNNFVTSYKYGTTMNGHDHQYLHCPRVGSGRAKAIFAGPDPGPKGQATLRPIGSGQGRARVDPGPMTKYILFIYLILYMAQTARLMLFGPILAISSTLSAHPVILSFKIYIYYKILVSI